MWQEAALHLTCCNGPNVQEVLWIVIDRGNMYITSAKISEGDIHGEGSSRQAL